MLQTHTAMCELSDMQVRAALEDAAARLPDREGSCSPRQFTGLKAWGPEGDGFLADPSLPLAPRRGRRPTALNERMLEKVLMGPPGGDPSSSRRPRADRGRHQPTGGKGLLEKGPPSGDATTPAGRVPVTGDRNRPNMNVTRSDSLLSFPGSLARPELFRLLADSQPGDVLLVEQVDRLSRLTTDDWRRLKAELTARSVRVVALDLPTSWVMATNNADEFTSRMFEAINGMLLDMLAAVARKDYDDRRRRQAQGIAKMKAEGKPTGRPEDTERNARIAQLLRDGVSWSSIQKAEDCSRSTILKVHNRMAAAPVA